MYYYPMTKLRHTKVTLVEPKPVAKVDAKPRRKRYHKKKNKSIHAN